MTHERTEEDKQSIDSKSHMSDLRAAIERRRPIEVPDKPSRRQILALLGTGAIVSTTALYRSAIFGYGSGEYGAGTFGS